MLENLRMWPYARKKYLFIYYFRLCLGKKLNSPWNKITKIGLWVWGVCQTYP